MFGIEKLISYLTDKSTKGVKNQVAEAKEKEQKHISNLSPEAQEIVKKKPRKVKLKKGNKDVIQS